MGFKKLTKNLSLREKCPNVGKYGPEKTLYMDTFHAVYDCINVFLRLYIYLKLLAKPLLHSVFPMIT